MSGEANEQDLHLKPIGSEERYGDLEVAMLRVN